MTEEQRKWYLAGVADMEAGRLVTKPDGLDFAVAQVRDRDLVIESLREQLAAANEILPEVEAQAERERVRAEAAEAKLAEAELELERERVVVQRLDVGIAEAERQMDRALIKSEQYNAKLSQTETAMLAAEAKLAEVEKERDEAEAALGEDVAVMFERGRRSANALREKLAAREASMDRARELAERQVPIARKEAEWTREATWSDAAIAFDQIARLLGGDDEPTTKGDA